MSELEKSSSNRDTWSDEQKSIGQRIKDIAGASGLGMKALHQRMSKFPFVSNNLKAFEHLLNGRVSPTFGDVVATAVDVLVKEEDDRAAKLSKWTQEERELRRAELSHFVLTGEDGKYALHELEDRITQPVIDRAIKEAAKAGWTTVPCDWGQGITNNAFNKRMLLDPPKIEVKINDAEWLAERQLGPWGALISGFVVRRAKQKSRHLTNDRKIRIASDFISTNKVTLQPTNYFSSLATDQIAWFRLSSEAIAKDGRPKETPWDGISAFIDQEGRLKSFSESKLSNQIGASVMALTDDGEMLVVHQNNRTHQSSGRLAPSGSGSLDWIDIGERTDLLDIVRHGAKRELEEECVLIDPNGKYKPIKNEILLTGFVRMLHRGGKPEFFGIARVEGKADDICARDPEKYVQQVVKAQITNADWLAGAAAPQIARMCREYLVQLKDSSGQDIALSYPFEHLLKHLVDVCEDHETASLIDKFMAPKVNR